MPTYSYECATCAAYPELNVPIKDRDFQWCGECGTQLDRKITFTGLTWAPSSTGGTMR